MFFIDLLGKLAGPYGCPKIFENFCGGFYFLWYIPELLTNRHLSRNLLFL